MANTRELISQVQDIKNSAEDLAQMCVATGEAIERNICGEVADLLEGKTSQGEILGILQSAARSAKQAGVYMNTIGRLCTDYISSIQ